MWSTIEVLFGDWEDIGGIEFQDIPDSGAADEESTEEWDSHLH